MDYLIVQLEGNEAVIARFRKQRSALLLVSASRKTFADGEELASLLRETASSLNEAVRTVLALSPSSLFLREIELPVSDRKKARELLPLELAGETALDGEEMVFDAIPLAGGKTLAIWGKRHELAERIELLAGQEVEPEIVTASLFHWQALIGYGAQGTVALTDGAALAVYQEGQPVFFRSLGSGGIEEVQRTLAVLEIGKGLSVNQVLLFGKALRQQPGKGSAAGTPPFLPLPVSGVMADAFTSEEDARNLANAYAAAHACAFGDPVNFRSGSLVYTAGQAKALKKLRLTLILAGILVLSLFAETGLRYYLVKRDLDSLNSSILSIYRTVFPTRKKPTDETAELRAEIKRLGGGAVTGNLLATLSRLAEAKGEDISGMYEVEMEKGEVRLKGDARSIQGVNDFKTRAAAIFPGAEVGEIKSRPDGSVSFVFRGTMKESAK